MKIDSNVNSVGEFWAEQLTEVANSEHDLKERIKLAEMCSRNFYKAASLILQAKQQMLKSPDIAGRDVVVQLSRTGPRLVEKKDEVA